MKITVKEDEVRKVGWQFLRW